YRVLLSLHYKASVITIHDPSHIYHYTLSLHDALPILYQINRPTNDPKIGDNTFPTPLDASKMPRTRLCSLPLNKSSSRHFRSIRYEEHTTELQSRFENVCRLWPEGRIRES